MYTHTHACMCYQMSGFWAKCIAKFHAIPAMLSWLRGIVNVFCVGMYQRLWLRAFHSYWLTCDLTSGLLRCAKITIHYSQKIAGEVNSLAVSLCNCQIKVCQYIYFFRIIIFPEYKFLYGSCYVDLLKHGVWVEWVLTQYSMVVTMNTTHDM